MYSRLARISYVDQDGLQMGCLLSHPSRKKKYKSLKINLDLTALPPSKYQKQSVKALGCYSVLKCESDVSLRLYKAAFQDSNQGVLASLTSTQHKLESFINWENTRSACGQAWVHLLGWWLMWKDLALCGWCRYWTSGLGCYKKTGWEVIRSKSMWWHSPLAPHLLLPPDSSLGWVPCLTSFNDGPWYRSVKWTNPSLYKLLWVMAFYDNQGNPNQDTVHKNWGPSAQEAYVFSLSLL